MTATTLSAALIAGNPGPAAHMALLGVVVVIGLIVFAFVRVRNKREQAEAQQADEGLVESAATSKHRAAAPHDHRHSGSARRH